jgi:nucleotide-binding universal stress UspA family protein
MNKFANTPILVPVDLADPSDRAVSYALEIASAPEHVTALHVGVPFLLVEPPYVSFLDEDARRKQLEEAVQARFAGNRYRGVRIAVRYGDPGTEIAAAAKELGAGLIVMPSHGRTGLSHLLIGSVAERVVRYASCPVLVLRGG